LRQASSETSFCKHLEAVVMSAPDAQEILTRRLNAARAVAKNRRPGESG
jgi:hypothetical protein